MRRRSLWVVMSGFLLVACSSQPPAPAPAAANAFNSKPIAQHSTPFSAQDQQKENDMLKQMQEAKQERERLRQKKAAEGQQAGSKG